MAGAWSCSLCTSESQRSSNIIAVFAPLQESLLPRLFCTLSRAIASPLLGELRSWVRSIFDHQVLVSCQMHTALLQVPPTSRCWRTKSYSLADRHGLKCQQDSIAVQEACLTLSEDGATVRQLVRSCMLYSLRTRSRSSLVNPCASLISTAFDINSFENQSSSLATED